MKSSTLLLFCIFAAEASALLYPRESETRDVRRLDGIWRFKLARIDDPDQGFREEWNKNQWNKIGLSFEPMPVPSSYNDITQNSSVRDHVGWAWYQTQFMVPKLWSAKRIMINFGSAHYNTVVFVNGLTATQHSGGHLPFEADISNTVVFGESNLLTVAINNTMTKLTIPQGTPVLKINNPNYPPFYYRNEGNFDFFNYAGIHRGVFLYATEKTYVQDITITTKLADETQSLLNFNVSVAGASSETSCKTSVFDRKDKLVFTSSIKACAGDMTIDNAKLWWPHTHSSQPGYLYSMRVEVWNDKNLLDVYTQKFGVRTVQIEGTKFLLNGKDFYFTGFGKHEDADIRGKGLDLPLIVKDINLIKWLGANSFRTSHYPYSEEIMDMCDEMGIAVIDETPAVGLMYFGQEILDAHKERLNELISRDKNRPSVFMWSVANEPESNQKTSEPYFKEVVAHAKGLDTTRPVTAALNVDPSQDMAGQFMDVIMFNKYSSWYSDTGSLEVIERQVVNKYTSWFTKHGKPVMISEYGGDTVAGLHMSPSFVFTEDYQSELLIKHHRAFDKLRAKGWFIGEHIWNFADFMTDQLKNGITRVVGNKKGVLTRQRQPKASAKILRCRYHAIANSSILDDAYYCPAIRSNTSDKDEL